jgi:chromate transport protein ChrA
LPDLFYNARSTYNWGFAYSIKNTDSNPRAHSYGIKPAIIAIILAAIYPLAKNL